MKKRIFLIFIIALLFFPFAISETPTEVSIANSPPTLISNIPNQSWPENENLIGAFNLDDYFEDANGDNISYWSSTPSNINIIIDSNNSVSFYPDAGFKGQREVTFYASDSTYNTSSNLVGLSVGVDTEPPKWFNPKNDQSNINQNDYVTFYTNWTDDNSLKKFIFSTNQTGVWTNYSESFFSGIENFSSQRIQISAPENTLVAWRFYAYDTSNNLNSTSLQFFTVQPLPEVPQQDSTTDNTTTYDNSSFINDTLEKVGLKEESLPKKSFELDFKDFHISLKQGNSRTSILKITNTGTESLDFYINSTGIIDFMVFSEISFTLEPGKSKQITVDFNIDKNTPPAQYFGSIIVLAGGIKKEVPIVVDVNQINLKFGLDVTIPSSYAVVKPGKNVTANLKISNLEDVIETSGILYTAVKDLKGNIYEFDEKNITFSSEINLEKNLIVPQDSPEGNYIFYARFSNSDGIVIDSEIFEVGTRFNLSALVKRGSIFLVIVILAAFLSAFMLRAQRTKKREKILELYMELSQLKKLVKTNKLDEALELYFKIKAQYNEPITKEDLKDKESIKKEILSLAGRFEQTKQAMKEEGISKDDSSSKDSQKTQKTEENKVKQETPKKPDKKVTDSKKEVKKDEKTEKK